MKALFIFLGYMVFNIPLSAQDCNIGNEEWFTGSYASELQPNFLLGVNFTLFQSGVLHSLNMIGQGTGADFQMAIYDDEDGSPGNLIAQTEISVVDTGINTLPVALIELSAGDYWIMAIYNDNGTSTNHSLTYLNDPTSEVAYTELNFGDAIPTDGSGFIEYLGQDLYYFAVINCGSLSVEEVQIAEPFVTPNPASDYIIVENLKKNTIIEIIDLGGKQLINKELNQTDNRIDIQALESGMYLLKCGDNRVVKFLKN